MYQQFKTTVLGKTIGDGECVSLVVNTSRAYIEFLYPNTNWTTIIPPVGGAREMANKGNQYVQWVANDHNNPNQLPSQGDIMVFDATPQAGYTNKFNNPYGHTGVCDSADAGGYSLLQQNAPAYRQTANVTRYAWNFRPCMGWYRPLTPGTSTPPSTPGRTIYLPPTTGPWHLYNADGPYLPAYAKGVISPALYGGLTYPIVADKGNGIIVINSQMYGQGALWTKGSDVVIS